MQNLKLPITLDPYKSAQRRLECQGYVELLDLERLNAVTQDNSGQINVNLTFDVDEQGLVTITGNAKTSLTLICQRCSDNFLLPMEVSFSFSPVKNEDAAEALPSYYDAIELDENGEVNLRKLVEDELLLAIPLIPKHELDDCAAKADTTWGELPKELSESNPFDVLKQLK